MNPIKFAGRRCFQSVAHGRRGARHGIPTSSPARTVHSEWKMESALSGPCESRSRHLGIKSPLLYRMSLRPARRYRLNLPPRCTCPQRPPRPATRRRGRGSESDRFQCDDLTSTRRGRQEWSWLGVETQQSLVGDRRTPRGWPRLHRWLPDSIPDASPFGAFSTVPTPDHWRDLDRLVGPGGRWPSPAEIGAAGSPTGQVLRSIPGVQMLGAPGRPDPRSPRESSRPWTSPTPR